MRGKVQSKIRQAALLRITPACAGKSPKVDKLQKIAEDHPRVCGEKFLQYRDWGAKTGITPACAGKRGSPPTRRTRCKDHPRVCGEKFSFEISTSDKVAVLPLTVAVPRLFLLLSVPTKNSTLFSAARAKVFAALDILAVMVTLEPWVAGDGLTVTATAESFCKLLTIEPATIPEPTRFPAPSKVPEPVMVPLLVRVVLQVRVTFWGTVRVLPSGTVKI